MEIYIILYGCADKPESDDIIGYVYSDISAGEYCEEHNKEAKEGYAYFWEPAKKLPW